MQVRDDRLHHTLHQSLPPLVAVPQVWETTIRQDGCGAGVDREPRVHTPSAGGRRCHSWHSSIALHHHGCVPDSNATRETAEKETKPVCCSAQVIRRLVTQGMPTYLTLLHDTVVLSSQCICFCCKRLRQRPPPSIPVCRNLHSTEHC